MDMGHRLATAALSVLLAGGLGACGAASDNPGPAPEAGRSPAIPSGPIRTLPSGKPPTIVTPPTKVTPPTELTPPAGEQTLTGVVQAGVEPGCLLMKTGGRTYQLIDGDPDIVHEGARLVITGHLVTGIMSYCMQGQPFHVSSAHAA
jgi:hypothetical protein